MQTTLSHVDDDDDDHTASKSSPVVAARRRRAGSLKAMRQCQSLPHASSQSTLRMLIESRVHLPTWSRDATERRGRRRDDHFLLDVVRDVSCELDLTRDSRPPARVTSSRTCLLLLLLLLDLTRLGRKMLANLAALACAQSASVYMMHDAASSTSWSAGQVT